MSEPISVLIADDNVEFAGLLKKYINRESDLKVVGIAGDGLEAVDLTASLTPDVVILDLIMPNLDGIGVLERISAMGINPKPVFIILSAIGLDVFVRRAILLGAEYYLVKPFDVSVLLKRIRQLVAERSAKMNLHECFTISRDGTATKPYELEETEYRITALLHKTGIPAHLKGYKYIREAVLYTVKNSKTTFPVTKVIYPLVAKKFNTSPQKVERAIRSAIESAWAKKADTSDGIFDKSRKPTNSEFLALMADRVRMATF